MDTPVKGTDGDTTLLSLVASEENLLDKVELSLRLDSMDALLGHLKPLERDLVVRYYGLDGRTPITLHALAKEVGLSRERVRQRISMSLRRLKVMAVQSPFL